MAKCECCGNSIGFSVVKYSVADMNGKDHLVCKNCIMLAKQKGEKIHYSSEAGKVVIGGSEEEIRKKCRVCGNIFCYTAADLLRNQVNAHNAKLDAIAGTANAFSGRVAASAVNQANAQSQLNQIVDYGRCPRCGSTDLIELSKNEYQAEINNTEKALAAASPADEIKKYKELLDLGIITQEEFDAKKKQLLGL